MTSGLSPARDGEIFDVIEIDGDKSPGVVTLSGHEREINLDVKQSDGQKGATTTYKGIKCGEFTATFSLIYDPANGVDDFEAWDLYAQKILSTVPPWSGAKPIARDIWHPDLERNGYSSVIMKKMGALQHDGKGGAKVTVTFAEYFPPKPAAAAGASGSKSKEDPNDPLVQARKELEGLLNEGKKP